MIVSVAKSGRLLAIQPIDYIWFMSWLHVPDLTAGLRWRLFLEMPRGHVLSELAREAVADVRTLAIGETSLTYAIRVATSLSERPAPTSLAFQLWLNWLWLNWRQTNVHPRK